MRLQDKCSLYNQRFPSSHDTQCLEPVLLSYLWVLCIIKCTASKFEVSLLPSLERAGLLQQLSFLNTGLGTKESTTVRWKSNSKPSPIQNQWPMPIRIQKTLANTLQITRENILFISQVNQENVHKVPESRSKFHMVLKEFTGRIGYWKDSGRQSPCLQLCTHWWIHQAPQNSSKPKATQTALFKLWGSQNKTKRYECEEEIGVGAE